MVHYTDQQHLVISTIGFTVGLAGFLCSVLTLVLIYLLKKWNGYLLLLVSLTVSQAIYDLNYILRLLDGDAWCYITFLFTILGGLASSIWTNILAFVITYTLWYSKSINIFRHYHIFSIFGTVIPLLLSLFALAIPRIIDINDDGKNDCHFYKDTAGRTVYGIYYWTRFISIIITMFFCFLTFWRVREMTENNILAIRTAQRNKNMVKQLGNTAAGSNVTNTLSHQSNASNSNTDAVLKTVTRMNYYALAQALCRSGAAWNEWNYGRQSSYAGAVMAAFCSPLFGVCNFIIFLVMQPNAWEICKCIFTCRALPEIKDEKSNPVSTNFSSSYGSEVDHDRMESTDSQSMEFSSGKMLGSSGRLFSVEDDIITNVNPILEDMMLQGDEDEENM